MDIQRLRLIIDSAPAAEGAAQWSKHTRQVSQDAMMATGSIIKMESALESVGRTMRTVAGAAGVGFGVAKIIEYADSYRRLEGQIKLVADSQRDVVRTERELFDVAQRTRSSYEATANLYVRVAQNAKELGRTQVDVMRFTETVQKAIQIGGSGAQEAKAGVIQLGQALGSGVLRGDEFRSVMENMRGVSQTLAQGLGVTVGQLRSMANNGELTAQKVVDAMLKMSDVVDDRFKKVPLTIGGAFTALDNGLRRYIGETDRGVGASSAFAGSIMLLARNVDTLANAAVLFGAAKLAGVISGLITPTLQEAKAIATGNAVLLESREAHIMRATAAKEAAAAELSGAQNATTALRAELAAITELQQAERRRYAEATTRVRTAVPEGQLAPLGGAVSMRDNAQVVMAMKQRAESEALLTSLGIRRAQVQADLNAVDTVALAATRANTAANIQRAMAVNISTGAMIAEAIAARAAAVATGMFNAAMSLVGGGVGLAILGLMLFVGWLLKKESAEGEAIETANQHTAAMREQRKVLDALHSAMAEDITDINRQQQALDHGGIKAEKRAQEEIKARDLARKYWKAYQAALKDDNSYDATVAKELTLEQAMKARSVVVVAAARQRVEMAGLVVSAQAKLDAAEERAKTASEKAKQASDERTRKLKEESEARVKATADVKTEAQAVELNSMAIGQSRQVREAWAMAAKINTEIHNKHAEAVASDSAQVAKEKTTLREFIATSMMATDALDRMTKARNSLRDARDDANVELQQAENMAAAWKKGADVVERLKIEQAADNAIRRMTLGLSDAQVAAMKDELDAYRKKLIALGQVNAANTASASLQKQDIQEAKRQAKDLANDSEQLVKNALRGAQSAAASFFESVLSGGVNSFQKLTDAMRHMFVRLFAELIAQQLGRQLITAMAAQAAASRVSLLRGGTNQPHVTAGQQGLLYGASGLAGFTLGYGIGQSTGNYGVAGVGGAASGALTGAMIAGPMGAVVGGVAGLVGGLLGHAAKLKAEAAALAKSRADFFGELDKFTYGLGDHTGLEKGLHDLQGQFNDMKKKAGELKLSYTDLMNAQKAVADATARMKQAFLDSIDAQIRTADGRGYVNDAIDAQKAYEANLKDIVLAGGEASKATELFTKQLDQLAKGLTADQIQDLMKQLPLLTKGMDPAAAKALADVLGKDLTAALKLAAKSAAQAAEEIRRAGEDLQIRYARTQGGDTRLLEMRATQNRETFDAQMSGASPQYMAELQLVHLYELSQAKIQAQTDAQVKAVQDATNLELGRLDTLAKAAQDQLRIQEDALGVAQQNLTATQKVVQQLTDYAKSLVVSDLSPLSPSEKYQQARAQLESAYTKAAGGDRDSAAQIPELINLFLQQSRGFNASDTNYAADFERVQQILAALGDSFTTQQGNEQAIVDRLQEQINLLNAQIEGFQSAADKAREDAQAQIAALTDSAHIQQLIRDDVVASIEGERDAMLAKLDAELEHFQAIKTQLDDALAKTDAQIYQLIAQRSEAQKNGEDNVDGINRQIATLILVRQQQEQTRDKVVDQISATNDARTAVQNTSAAQITAINHAATFTTNGFNSLQTMLALQHAENVLALHTQVDRIVASINGFADLIPVLYDANGRPRPPATVANLGGAAGGPLVDTSNIESSLHDVVNELRALRRESSAASATQNGALGQLALEFGEIAQQSRFADRETT